MNPLNNQSKQEDATVKLREEISALNRKFLDLEKKFSEHRHDNKETIILNENSLLNNQNIHNLRTIKQVESVADDEYIYFENKIDGIGVISAEGVEGALFMFTSAGAPTLISNTANVDDADTDGKLCVIDNGTGIIIRNRLGATKIIKLVIFY